MAPVGHLYRKLVGEIESAGLTTDLDARATGSVVTDQDVAGLPASVRRYLRFMGVVGRPLDRSFQLRITGSFRLRGGRAWMPAETWQYNTSPRVARIFVMRLRAAAIVPMVGIDAYIDGRGRMDGRLLGVVPVVRGSGEEFDLGELVTYLNDAVLLAPSFLLVPAVSFSAVDDDRFDVTLTDAGRSVTARVLLDAHGAPLDFSTTDRYADLPAGLVRAEWTTPVSGWTQSKGRPVPDQVTATWQFPEGPMPYFKARPQPHSLCYNTPPDWG